MPQLKSITGKRFGQIVVLEEYDSLTCLGRCDCGQVKKFFRANLRQGYTTKCHPNPPDPQRTKLLVVWHAMKARCLNQKHPNYKDYGGRGIKVCRRWLNFENFIADMGPVPMGMTLERDDNNGNYSPQNCRWATHQEQVLNTRQNVRLEFRGRTQTATEWANELGINRSTLYKRLNRSKWTVERALTTQ